MEFCDELNVLLTKTYKNIHDMEEEKVRRNKHLQLSISELHLLEAVGDYSDAGGATITELANDQGYTLPAITIAINGLERKGYVCKIRDEADKRSVRVRLTEQGRKINRVHQYIHKKLVREVAKEFNEEEMEVLIRGLVKVNDFFTGLNK
ncbi:MAG: MarR family winged helix-turn-helix transcriptional regulator [Eubacterium sp.]